MFFFHFLLPLPPPLHYTFLVNAFVRLLLLFFPFQMTFHCNCTKRRLFHFVLVFMFFYEFILNLMHDSFLFLVSSLTWKFSNVYSLNLFTDINLRFTGRQQFSSCKQKLELMNSYICIQSM